MYGESEMNPSTATEGASLPSMSGQDEDDEHVVIGRLIRRLRVSEPPERFQHLAVTVFRSSTGAESVGWVPREPVSPPIVAGHVAGLEPIGYRALIPRVSVDPIRDDPIVVDRPPPDAPPEAIRQTAAASGPSGWLIALNPPAGRPFSAQELERLHYVAALIEAQLANARAYAEVKGLLFGVVRSLTAAIDAKDPYTSGHSERVARIAVRIAEELHIPPERRSDLYLAGLLHDVGKIGIEDEVLKKSGPLSDEEYRKIQGHVEIGVNILKDLKRLSHILPGVRHHHESYDGTGYPDRLAGDHIPIEARILAVADSFDAMSSSRPYRRRMGLMQIQEILDKGRGKQWDPRVIEALFACRAELEAIGQKGLGESLIGAVDVALGRELDSEEPRKTPRFKRKSRRNYE